MGVYKAIYAPLNLKVKYWPNTVIFIGLDGEPPTDSRGAKETLYKATDGRLIVYVEKWSRWLEEPNMFLLKQASKDDFDVGGEFESLGRKAGLGRPLTLDEALLGNG